jgi:hypothetical protein
VTDCVLDVIAAAVPEVRAVVNVSTSNLALPKGSFIRKSLIEGNKTFSDIILMTIVGMTVVLALVIVTVGYVCYKRLLFFDILCK